MMQVTKEQKQLAFLQGLSLDILSSLLDSPEHKNIIKASSIIRKWITVFPAIERREKINKIGFSKIADALQSILEDPDSDIHPIAAAEGVFWSGVFQKIEAAEQRSREQIVKKKFNWKE